MHRGKVYKYAEILNKIGFSLNESKDEYTEYIRHNEKDVAYDSVVFFDIKRKIILKAETTSKDIDEIAKAIKEYENEHWKS